MFSVVLCVVLHNFCEIRQEVYDPNWDEIQDIDDSNDDGEIN